MTITLPLQPQEEALLVAAAQAKGVSTNDLVREALDKIVADALMLRGPERGPGPSPARARSFVELFEPIRGLFEDGELDFSRSRDMGRPVDLS